jgi:hypothetical protein
LNSSNRRWVAGVAMFVSTTALMMGCSNKPVHQPSTAPTTPATIVPSRPGGESFPLLINGSEAISLGWKAGPVVPGSQVLKPLLDTRQAHLTVAALRDSDLGRAYDDALLPWTLESLPGMTLYNARRDGTTTLIKVDRGKGQGAAYVAAYGARPGELPLIKRLLEQRPYVAGQRIDLKPVTGLHIVGWLGQA